MTVWFKSTKSKIVMLVLICILFILGIIMSFIFVMFGCILLGTLAGDYVKQVKKIKKEKNK